MMGGFILIFSAVAWIGIAFLDYYLAYHSTYGFRPQKGLRVTEEEEKLGVDSLFVESESVQQSSEERIQELEKRIQELEGKIDFLKQ